MRERDTMHETKIEAIPPSVSLAERDAAYNPPSDHAREHALAMLRSMPPDLRRRLHDLAMGLPNNRKNRRFVEALSRRYAREGIRRTVRDVRRSVERMHHEEAMAKRLEKRDWKPLPGMTSSHVAALKDAYSIPLF